MSEWYDNRSAEVVLRPQRNLSNERKCLEGCLERLKPAERALVLHLYGAAGDLDRLAALRGKSQLQLKKIRSRLLTCIKKCVREAEDKSLLL